MLYELGYVEEFEEMSLLDEREKEIKRLLARAKTTVPAPSKSFDEVLREWRAEASAEPEVSVQRTAAEIAHPGQNCPAAAAFNDRPADPAPGTNAIPEQAEAATSQKGLLQRALRMFGGGRQNPVVPGDAAGISEVTGELVMTVKAAVSALFNDHADCICYSPERPDLGLSQEEALGHLVGSLFVGEVLVHEARPLGKRLDFRAGKESKAQAAEKESIRQKKKSLRKKKGLTPEELARACEAVDEGHYDLHEINNHAHHVHRVLDDPARAVVASAKSLGGCRARPLVTPELAPKSPLSTTRLLNKSARLSAKKGSPRDQRKEHAE